MTEVKERQAKVTMGREESILLVVVVVLVKLLGAHAINRVVGA
jgi:uncharacterized protein (UPF0548 family)